MKNRIPGGLAIHTDESDILICAGVDVSGEEIPDEIDVLAEGSYMRRLPDGRLVRFEVTAEDIDAAFEQFKARRERHPNRDLVIDYEHQTLTGSEAPAAGWISDLLTTVREGKKYLRAKVSIWTDRARQYIKNKEYRYVSPVFALGSTDKETGKVERCILKNVALTNEPLLDELAPIVAKHLTNTVAGKESNMDELLERLRWFLNIPTTSTASEILVELNKLASQIKEAIASEAEADTVTAKNLIAFLTEARAAIAAKADLFKAIGADANATLEEARALVVVAKGNSDQVGTLTTRVQELEAKEVDREFNRIIAKAFTAGRILPTQKSDADWMKSQREFAAKDLAKFESFWDKQPVIAPVGALPEGGGEHAAKHISEEDRAIAGAMGITEDQLKKHNS